MEQKEVKFSLVFRDMWQSAGKYVPRVDQLVKVAPAIIEMGCFARVETNGGGFEQVNLLFGENPNKAVREWTKPFHRYSTSKAPTCNKLGLVQQQTTDMGCYQSNTLAIMKRPIKNMAISPKRSNTISIS